MFSSFFSPRRQPACETRDCDDWFESGALSGRSRTKPPQSELDALDSFCRKPRGWGADIPHPPFRTLTGDEPIPLWELRITQPAFLKTMIHLNGLPPEQAGAFLSRIEDESLIVDFVADDTGRGTAVSFELDATNLNRILQEKKAIGLTCTGIAHSHPTGIIQPSMGDLVYYRRLFKRPANTAATHLFVPIICGGRMYPYVFARNRIHRATLTLV